MEKDFSDILKQIGFTDGLHIPVANDENKQLQKEIEDKLRFKAELLVKCEHEEDQKTRTIKSLENMRNQKLQNQQIIVALRNQSDTERTIVKECSIGRSAARQQINSMNKEIKDSKQKQRSLKTEIRRNMTKLDDLKAVVKWGEEARKAWQEELAIGERDNNILQRFKVEDQAKFKELDLKRQRLKLDVIEQQSFLRKVMNTHSVLENQMQNLTHFFKRIHKEQLTLISFWENAVRNLHQRETDMEYSYQRIQKLKMLADKHLNSLAEEQKFHAIQCANNDELQAQVDELNGELMEVKQAGIDAMMFISQAKHEEAKIHKVLSDVGMKLERARRRCSQMDETIKTRKSREHTLHQPIADLSKRLDEVTDSVLSSAERSKELTEISKSADIALKQLKDKYAIWEKKVFDKHKDCSKAKLVIERVLEQVTVMNVNERAFQETRIALEKEVMKRENILYNLSMESVRLHHRLRKAKRDLNLDEQIVYKVRAWELEDAIKRDSKKMKYIRFHYKKLKAAADRVEDANKELKLDIKNVLIDRGHVAFGIEGTNKHLATWQHAVKSAQVALNVLRLRLDQREKALEKHDSQVISLEVEKVELDKAVRERKLEIDQQMDLMAAKKRTFDEERSELKKALEQLKIRTTLLQKKHDVIMDSIGKDEDGETFSVARFKIKMAQERHELEEIGDELDAKIKKAENEIPAMENTLRVISAANECYKRNLDSIEADSPEVEEKRRLEDQITELTKELQERQEVFKDLTAQIHELEFTLSDLTECEDRLRTEWRENDIAARALDKELEEQQRKLGRAEKLLRKIKKETIAQRVYLVPPLLVERDIEVRELQDINQSAMQQLAELGCRFSEITPVLHRYTSEKGLHLPLVRGQKPKHAPQTPRSILSSHRSLLTAFTNTTFGSVASRSASVIMLDLGSKFQVIPGLRPRRSDKPSRIYLRPNPKKKNKDLSNNNL